MEIRETDGGVLFKIKVQPRASKNETSGMIGDAVKLRITAPPVDGAANEAVVKFLAKVLGVPKSAVEIVSGLSSREKTVLIAGVTPPRVREALNL